MKRTERDAAAGPPTPATTEAAPNAGTKANVHTVAGGENFTGSIIF